MFSSKKGFYIVESMVALGILTFAFLGMLTLLAKSLSLNRVISDAYTANFLALEGVELAKNVVDANIAFRQNFNEDCKWNSGFEAAGEYETDWTLPPVVPGTGKCPGEEFVRDNGYQGKALLRDADGRYGHTSGDATSFVRKIAVTPVNPDELQVESIVTWTTRGGGSFRVDVEDRLYNWQRR